MIYARTNEEQNHWNLLCLTQNLSARKLICNIAIYLGNAQVQVSESSGLPETWK